MRNIIMAAVLIASVGSIAGTPAARPAVAASMPDGRVRIELEIRKAGDVDAAPHYRVTFDGNAVVGRSRFGVELDGGAALGGPCEVMSVDTKSVRDEFTQVAGKRWSVRAEAAEVVVSLRGTIGMMLRWDIHLSAYVDGAAFRYRFPEQDGWDALAIRQERTEFSV